MANKKKRKQSTASQPPPSNVQVVVFDDPSKKRAKKKDDEQNEPASSSGISLDWQRARHEVFRFGIAGLEQKEQTDAKVSLAVKLGARPAPNKCINYKLLMEQRKRQKEEERVQQLESGNDRYKLKPLVARKKRSGKKDQTVQA